MEEMGVRNRESIRRWFRELQHYGFIVMTNPGRLGVEGKGKAPQWRLTELETPLAAGDYFLAAERVRAEAAARPAMDFRMDFP